jgi:hypothetical protein
MLSLKKRNLQVKRFCKTKLISHYYVTNTRKTKEFLKRPWIKETMPEVFVLLLLIQLYLQHLFSNAYILKLLYTDILGSKSSANHETLE